MAKNKSIPHYHRYVPWLVLAYLELFGPCYLLCPHGDPWSGQNALVPTTQLPDDPTVLEALAAHCQLNRFDAQLCPSQIKAPIDAGLSWPLWKNRVIHKPKKTSTKALSLAIFGCMNWVFFGLTNLTLNDVEEFGIDICINYRLQPCTNTTLRGGYGNKKDSCCPCCHKVFFESKIGCICSL